MSEKTKTDGTKIGMGITIFVLFLICMWLVYKLYSKPAETEAKNTSTNNTSASNNNSSGAPANCNSTVTCNVQPLQDEIALQKQNLKNNTIYVDEIGTFNAATGDYDEYKGSVPFNKLQEMIALGKDIQYNDTITNDASAGLDSGVCRMDPEKCYAYTFRNDDWNKSGQFFKRKNDEVMPVSENKDVNLYVRNAKHVKLPAASFSNGLYSLDVLKGNILTGAEITNADFLSIPDDKKYYPACIEAAGKDFDGAMIGTQNNKPWCAPFKSKGRDSSSDPAKQTYLTRGAASMVYIKNPSTINYGKW